MKWVLSNVIRVYCNAWFSIISDHSNFKLLLPIHSSFKLVGLISPHLSFWILELFLWSWDLRGLRKTSFFCPFWLIKFQEKFMLFFLLPSNTCMLTHMLWGKPEQVNKIFFLAIGLLLKWHRQQHVGGICGVWGVSQHLLLNSQKTN